MREYDEETLKHLQKVQLGILKDVISVCEDAGVSYFAIAGTAIGAVRHGGFIPWDDDIDIAMLRADYDVFYVAFSKKYPEKYTVMNCEVDDNYPSMNTRIMLRGTEYREEPYKDIDCPFGIFVDIFVLDNISDNEQLCRKQMRDAFLWSKIQILRSVPEPILAFKGWKAALTRCMCRCAHAVMSFCGISKKRINEKCLSIAKAYSNLDTQQVGFLFDTTPDMNTYCKAEIFPLVKYPFEDIKINLANNYHSNLAQVYGDYMQLPKPEDRKNHYPYRLDFGEY